jgi:hypothetical protein
MSVSDIEKQVKIFQLLAAEDKVIRSKLKN